MHIFAENVVKILTSLGLHLVLSSLTSQLRVQSATASVKWLLWIMTIIMWPTSQLAGFHGGLLWQLTMQFSNPPSPSTNPDKDLIINCQSVISCHNNPTWHWIKPYTISCHLLMVFLNQSCLDKSHVSWVKWLIITTDNSQFIIDFMNHKRWIIECVMTMHMQVFGCFVNVYWYGQTLLGSIAILLY